MNNEEIYFNEIKTIAAKLCVPYCPGDKIIKACNRFLGLQGLVNKENILSDIECHITTEKSNLDKIEKVISDLRRVKE